MGVAERQALHARYEAAERLLPHRWKELILPGGVGPNWIRGSDRFWYSRRTASGDDWIVVDPASASREPAFERSAVAEALSTGLERTVEARRLPVDGIEVRGDGQLRLHVDGRTWSWQPATQSLTPTPVPAPRPFVDALSPDARSMVHVSDHNLVLCDRETGRQRNLTGDGLADYGYGEQADVSTFRFTLEPAGLRMPPAVAWSPDSRRLVAHRIDQRALPLMHYVQSTPADGGRPRLVSEHYAMVGEEAVPVAELVVVDIESGDVTWADAAPVTVGFVAPITARHVWWARDGECVYFLAGTRGDRAVRLYRLDPVTGETQLLVEERSDTQVQVHPLYGGRPNIHAFSTGEVLWWSERSGWGHLYLYEPDGVVRPVTAGEWLVRDLVCVEEETQTLLFTASGREPSLDPYVRQLYRLDLGSGEIERVSHDALDHNAVGSPSGRYVVDVASWVDAPERSVLRDVGGRIVMELEQADAKLLYGAGWKPPERFKVKADDGETDLYGLLYEPHQLDPAQRYPILDDIYPGPQMGAATVRFCERGIAEHAASMAALGFAVVVVDGRGTPLRSKPFQEWCRGANDGVYLDDHVAAIRQLAAERPWLDLDRVGIYGLSGGGRASTQAMLRQPRFYRVAVSVAGNHDDELYTPGWGEKYIGHPEEVDYRSHANASRVDRLEGKLLLIHGELDNNVHPYMTLRLVDALMAANKDFDLLIVPNAAHEMAAHKAYWLRRRWDYFVRHLQHREPPHYRIDDIPADIEMLLAAFA